MNLDYEHELWLSMIGLIILGICLLGGGKAVTKTLSYKKTLRKVNSLIKKSPNNATVYYGEGLYIMQELISNSNDFKRNLQEVHEARILFEKCLDAHACDEEFLEFLKKIANLKKRDFNNELVQELVSAHEELGDFFLVLEQVEIQLKQTEPLLDEVLAIQDTREKETGRRTIDSRNISFEEKFLFEIYEGISKQLIEANEILISVSQDYWDYFPAILQEALCRWVKIIETSVYQKALRKIYKDYEKSFESLHQVISDLVVESKLTTKFRSSNLHEQIPQKGEDDEKSFSKDLPGKGLYPERQYTLEELIKNITPESRHEEIDWGRPVGEEIW